MQFHKVVVKAPADALLRKFGCRLKGLEEDLFVGNAVEVGPSLRTGQLTPGEDNSRRGPWTWCTEFPLRIVGTVVQWAFVTMDGLHLDPLVIKCKAVIHFPGHFAEVLSMVSKNFELGYQPWARCPCGLLKARNWYSKTRGVCPGLFAAGMAVVAIDCTPRVGLMFGGMLVSGAKVAQLVREDIK